MIDPAAFRTSMLVAADLTVRTAQTFFDFWGAVLTAYEPADRSPAPPAAAQPAAASPAPAAPMPAAAARLPFVWHGVAPHTAFADLVAYQVQIATPGPDVPVADTLLGVAADLAAIAALGVNALHLTPRRRGGRAAAFTSATIDAFALADPATIDLLLPALNVARPADVPPRAAADLAGGLAQLQCLVDLCHLAGIGVLVDLQDEEATTDFAARARLDGVRVAAADARVNDSGGRLVWAGRSVGPAARDDLRLALRDLLRTARAGGPLPLDALGASLAAAQAEVGLHALATPDDVEALAILADPQAPDGWTARSRLRLLTALLFAAPGAPALQAAQAEPGTAGARFLQAMVALRSSEPGLRGGGLRVAHCDPRARVVSLHRWVSDGGPGRDIIVVANLSGTTHHDYRIGLPRGGFWREVLNTDAFDGALERAVIGNGGMVDAHDGPLDGFAHSVPMILPPNAALFFTPRE